VSSTEVDSPINNRRLQILGVAIAGMAVLASTFEATATNVILPQIADEYGIDIQLVQWVVLTSLAVNCSLLLTMGRLGDIFGRALILRIGFVILAFGSLLLLISPNFTVIIIARGIQAVATAMMQGVGPGLIVSVFPASQRGRALGIFGTITSIGLSAGPIAAGLFAGEFGWRSIYGVMIPVAVIGFAFTTMGFASVRLRDQNLDIRGAILYIIWLAPLLFVLNQIRQMGFDSPIILTALFVVALFMPMFVVSQLRAQQPLVNLAVFKIRSFSLGFVSAFLGFGALSAGFLLIPFYLNEVLRWSPPLIGVGMAFITGTMVFTALISGRVADRYGARYPASMGLAFIAIGFWLLSQLGMQASIADVLVRILIVGFGLGIFEWPTASSIMGSLPRSMLGVGGAYMSTARALGFAACSAVFGTIFAAVVLSSSGGASALDATPPHLVEGFEASFRFAAILAVGGVLAAWFQGDVAIENEN